ncbi:MAG: LD-carboxypeptidase [Clostridiales bacterium]|nr:LD-carboxypeptidase [Clostridiales bacterium]
MILPKFLEPGDKAALVAPSSPEPTDRMEAVAASVRAFGLEPVIFPSCYGKRGYLAGSDRERAKDLMDAFADPDIKAVLCVRGGYGAHRLMEYLDWDAIAASRKGLYGYSDITALHLEMNRRGVASWHTPMPGEEWYKGLAPFVEENLRAALFGPLPIRVVNPAGAPLTVLFSNPSAPSRSARQAAGILCGGNLTLVTATLGTYYEIDTHKKVLFLEDVDEYPHRVDRMLLQLRNAGKFRDCAGVILGQFTHCDPPEGKPSLSLTEIFTDLLGDLGKPVVMGLECGHCSPSVCLPLGVYVLLDASTSQGTLGVLGV